MTHPLTRLCAGLSEDDRLSFADVVVRFDAAVKDTGASKLVMLFAIAVLLARQLKDKSEEDVSALVNDLRRLVVSFHQAEGLK